MSRGYNKNGLFIDVGLLRDHISELREEKKMVERLYENVVAMKNCSDPSVYGQHYAILHDIDQLVEYFGRMTKVLAEAEAEAIQLSHTIGDKIEENTDRVRHTFSQSFML